MSSSNQSTVLAVDDDQELLGTYELWLRDDVDLRTASAGPEALDKLDSEIDVVLLDRMMSGFAGRDVLERIRDRDGTWRVLMVTAVDPDFDIVDMDYDGYLSKPLTKEQLVEAISTVRSWRTYSRHVQEYVRARSTLETLESTKKTGALEDSDTYSDLKEEVSSLESNVDADLDNIDSLLL